MVSEARNAVLLHSCKQRRTLYHPVTVVHGWFQSFGHRGKHRRAAPAIHCTYVAFHRAVCAVPRAELFLRFWEGRRVFIFVPRRRAGTQVSKRCDLSSSQDSGLGNICRPLRRRPRLIFDCSFCAASSQRTSRTVSPKTLGRCSGASTAQSQQDLEMASSAPRVEY